ncbi:MAG TPA: M1 family aminopeptidase [Pyrinomonadaceae bacterium]|nr:M1 family aminopeptidase [Pyrinomonadaceae bacterium]
MNLTNLDTPVSERRCFRASLLAVLFVVVLQTAPSAFAQTPVTSAEKDVYSQIRTFALGGGSATVNGLVLKRDRGEMTFTGTFYFATPVEGHITGAVFVGDGQFTAPLPPSGFEKDNVKRLLNADVVASDFKTAVLRFSDDTFEQLGQKPVAAQAEANTQKLGADLEARVLKETGVNLSARIATSILNKEQPGFFFANFDGGKRGRFGFVLDYQNRVLVSGFELNAGEKGVIYSYKSEIYSPEIWLAFYGLEDYSRGNVGYADTNNQLDVTHFDMDLDLRDNKKAVRLFAKVDAEVKAPNLRAIAFKVGEGLSEFESERLKKQMRLQKARLGETDVAFAQEDWEGGFTVFLPTAPAVGSKLTFELLLQGDFLKDPDFDCDCHYPRSTVSWYPRAGYLDRATFDLTFHHNKKVKVASIGKRVSEEPDPEIKDAMVTKYEMPHAVPLVTFALAPFERHAQMVRFDKGGVGDPIPVEFNSLSGSVMPIKEDFILAELDNSLRYFTALFGKYPYATFGAAFHPYPFGQGFPSLLMIPRADKADRRVYLFIAHETAHQWWGDIVTWRSYRDQWLSEGFAEYSGMLYTGLRSGPEGRDALISEARQSLSDQPQTLNGVGKGKLYEVGPIILGHRLQTTKTFGAYQTLIYNKGALVLRMLHFLFTDPETGNGDAFFAMMSDFVNRYHDGYASTDDFRRVANDHFVKSPIGRAYQLRDLNWFFSQWVYQSALPSYQLEYHFQDQPDGKVLFTGNVSQTNAGENWFMVLPVALTFGGKQVTYTTVVADGPTAPFSIKLPSRPSRVELDPQHWVLSEKTSTKGG